MQWFGFGRFEVGAVLPRGCCWWSGNHTSYLDTLLIKRAAWTDLSVKPLTLAPLDANFPASISPLQFNPPPALLSPATNPKSAALRSKNIFPPPGQLRGSGCFVRVRIAVTLELISIELIPTASIGILYLAALTSGPKAALALNVLRV